MIDVHYASLTSQGVQHRVIYLDGHPSRYQPRPTGFNFGEQTGNSVFPWVIAVPQRSITWLTYYTQLKNLSFQQSTSTTDTNNNKLIIIILTVIQYKPAWGL